MEDRDEMTVEKVVAIVPQESSKPAKKKRKKNRGKKDGTEKSLEPSNPPLTFTVSSPPEGIDDVPEIRNGESSLAPALPSLPIDKASTIQMTEQHENLDAALSKKSKKKSRKRASEQRNRKRESMEEGDEPRVEDEPVGQAETLTKDEQKDRVCAGIAETVNEDSKNDNCTTEESVCNTVDKKNDSNHVDSLSKSQESQEEVTDGDGKKKEENIDEAESEDSQEEEIDVDGVKDEGKKTPKKVSPDEQENSIVLKEVAEVEKYNKEQEEKERREGITTNTGVLTEVEFRTLGLVAPLLEAVDAMGWKVATRIQAESLPHSLAGRDLIGLAETGSGKTGAFAIPILQSLLVDASRKTHPVGRGIYAVILAPTRELAYQIHGVVTALGTKVGATSCCVVGGIDSTSQAVALVKHPHVCVATPGRLVDHLTNTKGFSLKYLRFLVLDEADRMLSMDFEEEIDTILGVIPESDKRRTMLFSATMTSKVQKLQRASLTDPVRVEVSTKFSTPKKLLQHYLFFPAIHKDCYLAYLLACEFHGKTALVFCGTCNNVQRVTLLLRNLGIQAVCLHGRMTQNRRLGALQKFTAGHRSVLVCTDVASRGLDIPHVDVVLNFDLPNHGKDYVHRVGRTARAGRSGTAVALVTQYDVEVYQRLEGLLGKKLELYPHIHEAEVLRLSERVGEAQRLATRELKEQLAAQGGRLRKGGPRRITDDGADGDGDVRANLSGAVRQEYGKERRQYKRGRR